MEAPRGSKYLRISQNISEYLRISQSSSAPPHRCASAMDAASSMSSSYAEAEFDEQDGSDLVPVLSSVLQQLVERDDRVRNSPILPAPN
eukprot:SAG31_NODE_2230_length_6144_cov_3.629115_9_plen_89_part_00